MVICMRKVCYATKREFGTLTANKISDVAVNMDFQVDDIKGDDENESITIYLRKLYDLSPRYVFITIYGWARCETLERLINYTERQVDRVRRLLELADKILSEYPIKGIKINDDCVTFDFPVIHITDVQRLIESLRDHASEINEIKLNGRIRI